MCRLVSFGVTALGAALLAAILLLVEVSRPGPTAGDTAPVSVVIPRGASVTSIARALEQQGVVRSALTFRVAKEVVARGKSLQAGEYAFAPGVSVRGVIDGLVGGDVLLHPITLPEGRTVAAAFEILARSDVLTGDLPAMPPEGALLPETYMVTRGMDRGQLVAQMLEAQTRTMDELWPQRAEGLPFKTREQALILASIVERETGVPDERPRVAAVFVNRLRRGMRLESDPTIIYGVCVSLPERCQAGRLVDAEGRPRGIRQSEIKLDTGYNTYQIDGLPPTPIANPGREAIAAVLNPPKTDELFFVALSPDNPRDGHVFSKTYAEHQRAVARLRAAERSLP